MKEIELLKIIFKDSPDILEPLNKIDKEIERLNNIIKEAIEYIEDNSDDMHTYISQAITQILKGSDKE